MVINRADRTITTCNPDGSQSLSALLNALPAGRRAVEQGLAGDLTVSSRGSAPVRTLDAILSDQPLYLTAYGAAPGQFAGVALQAALNDCGTTGRPVRIPAGTWIFNTTSAFPTGAGSICPGVEGEGANTILAIIDYNGPIISATVQSGVAMKNKRISGLNTQAQWSSANPAYDRTALIEIKGASVGWTFSTFHDLGGYAIKRIVSIGTDYAVFSGDGKESHSGWNNFTGLYGGVGSQGIMPTDFVYYPLGSSTGNTFTDFRGGASRAFLRFEGEGYVVGDIVVTGSQSGNGRIISVGPYTTYNRNITMDGTQVDASSLEVIEQEATAIPLSRLKINGSLGGSIPWNGLPPTKHSAIRDLGESYWPAGGRVVGYTGTGAHTVELWKVTLAPSTMTRFEVSLVGLVGGVDSGGTIQTFDAACGYNTVAKVAPSPPIKIAANLPKVPATWIAFTTAIGVVSGKCQVTVFATWNDISVNTELDTNISARHGSFKVEHGANVPL